MELAAVETIDVFNRANGKQLTKPRVLAPFRGYVQIELAYTDMRTIGIEAPTRNSSGSQSAHTAVALVGPKGRKVGWTSTQGSSARGATGTSLATAWLTKLEVWRVVI